MVKKQNRCLNVVKGLACFLVIILHCEFPTYIGSVINIIARIAVPVFFMISGFFLYSTDREAIQKKLPRKCLHIFKLTLLYYLINIVYEIVQQCFISRSLTVTQELAVIFGGQNLFDAVVWNRTIVGMGGWFLSALLYCYIILIFINKANLYRYAYGMIIPLFVCYFLLSQLMHVPVWCARNFLFDGLPFVLLGNYIAYKKEDMAKLTNVALLLLFGAGGLLACVERVFCGGQDLYIGVIVMSFAIFVFAINNEQFSLGRGIEYIGQNLYLYCYLLHPFFIYLMRYLGSVFGIENAMWFMWIRPILVIICTVSASAVVYTINRKNHSISDRKASKEIG